MFKVLTCTFIVFCSIINNIQAIVGTSWDLELKQAEPCNLDKCQPPNCRCSGLTLPKEEFKGHEKEIPQVEIFI